MTMQFGTHHEWGKLREVVIGISPAEDFVVNSDHELGAPSLTDDDIPF